LKEQPNGLERWKARARQLKQETYALYLAYRDPRTPWYAKVLAGVVVAYAFSPIDLIPDPVPVLGYLDDLLLVPLGIALAIRVIPAPVRRPRWPRASRRTTLRRPSSSSSGWHWPPWASSS